MRSGLCVRCARGDHRHDRMPDGSPAECPYQGIDGDVDSVCSCTVGVPEALRPPLLPQQRAPRLPDEETAATYGVTREQAYVDALRSIAAETVRVRARTNSMGQPTREDGAALLVECERQLTALIALGYVPQDPGNGRRRLTS